MNKIIKYLDSNNINYKKGKTSIIIYINKDMTFINSYGDTIHYDNYILIVDKYSYHPYELEVFFDRRLKTKYMSGKQVEIIAKLEKTLKENKLI